MIQPRCAVTGKSAAGKHPRARAQSPSPADPRPVHPGVGLRVRHQRVSEPRGGRQRHLERATDERPQIGEKASSALAAALVGFNASVDDDDQGVERLVQCFESLGGVVHQLLVAIFT